MNRRVVSGQRERIYNEVIEMLVADERYVEKFKDDIGDVLSSMLENLVPEEKRKKYDDPSLTLKSIIQDLIELSIDEKIVETDKRLKIVEQV